MQRSSSSKHAWARQADVPSCCRNGSTDHATLRTAQQTGFEKSVTGPALMLVPSYADHSEVFVRQLALDIRAASSLADVGSCRKYKLGLPRKSAQFAPAVRAPARHQPIPRMQALQEKTPQRIELRGGPTRIRTWNQRIMSSGPSVDLSTTCVEQISGFRKSNAAIPRCSHQLFQEHSRSIHGSRNGVTRRIWSRLSESKRLSPQRFCAGVCLS